MALAPTPLPDYLLLNQSAKLCLASAPAALWLRQLRQSREKGYKPFHPGPKGLPCLVKSHVSFHLVEGLDVEPNAFPFWHFCAKSQAVTTHICIAVWVSAIIYPHRTWENEQASSTFGRGGSAPVRSKGLFRATLQVSSSSSSRTSTSGTCLVTPSLPFQGMFSLVTCLSHTFAQLSLLTGLLNLDLWGLRDGILPQAKNFQMSEKQPAE